MVDVVVFRLASQIAVWDLMNGEGSAGAAASAVVPVGDVQLAVRFNPDNIAEIMSNGKQRVFFWCAPEAARCL